MNWSAVCVVLWLAARDDTPISTAASHAPRQPVRVPISHRGWINGALGSQRHGSRSSSLCSSPSSSTPRSAPPFLSLRVAARHQKRSATGPRCRRGLRDADAPTGEMHTPPDLWTCPTAMSLVSSTFFVMPLFLTALEMSRSMARCIHRRPGGSHRRWNPRRTGRFTEGAEGTVVSTKDGRERGGTRGGRESERETRTHTTGDAREQRRGVRRNASAKIAATSRQQTNTAREQNDL